MVEDTTEMPGLGCGAVEVDHISTSHNLDRLLVLGDSIAHPLPPLAR